MSQLEHVMGVRSVVGDAVRCRSGMVEFAVPSPYANTVRYAVDSGLLDMVGNGVARVTAAGRVYLGTPFKLEHNRLYVDREGTARKVRLVSDGCSGSRFEFESAEEGLMFMADGRYVEDESPCSAYNLVDDAPTPRHTQ